MDQVLVAVEGLCKRYPDTLALDNLSFHLKRGEILGLLGPNGAGKTTAIHILLGLLTPSTGEVSVFGLSPLKDRHRIAKRLNFSSAYVNLPTNLKVYEVLNVFSRLYLVKNAAKKIKSLLDLFEISHLKNRVTGALSAGEKTRLNLCKCLLNDPELLLLDEPSASLDPEMADTMRGVLKKIQKEQGIGIVYTSHNMMEVEELCDRILFIHQGKKIAEGSAEEVKRTFKSGSLQEVFIKIVRNGDLIL
ncbi:MAG: ABC transporter ATP-binding protein [Deltaproteobacteria bacterium]|nr:ABC transporter ATP-binding protein [Deltaproteobacteria bacterium]